MSVKFLKYTLFILFVCTGLFLHAQNKPPVSYDYKSKVEQRTSEKINDFLNDKEFQYDTAEAKPAQSLVGRILQWILNQIYKFLRLLDEGGKPVSYTFYAIIFAVLLFVIIKLLGLKYQGLFIRSKKISDAELDVFDEDIHEINFNDIIDEAVRNGNYRTAVRYMYIKYLKILTDHELIKWEKNKTNKDYFNEMKNTKFFTSFNRLTFIYDYVWYGEFSVDKQSFSSYYNEFNKEYSAVN